MNYKAPVDLRRFLGIYRGFFVYEMFHEYQNNNLTNFAAKCLRTNVVLCSWIRPLGTSEKSYLISVVAMQFEGEGKSSPVKLLFENSQPMTGLRLTSLANPTSFLALPYSLKASVPPKTASQWQAGERPWRSTWCVAWCWQGLWLVGPWWWRAGRNPPHLKLIKMIVHRNMMYGNNI